MKAQVPGVFFCDEGFDASNQDRGDLSFQIKATACKFHCLGIESRVKRLDAFSRASLLAVESLSATIRAHKKLIDCFTERIGSTD